METTTIEKKSELLFLKKSRLRLLMHVTILQTTISAKCSMQWNTLRKSSDTGDNIFCRIISI